VPFKADSDDESASAFSMATLASAGNKNRANLTATYGAC